MNPFIQILKLNKAIIQFLRMPEPTFENDIYSKLFNCFKRVIWDSKIEGVGGVIVPLCSDNGKFSYINYTDIISDPLRLEEFSVKPKPISFGTPQGGGYAVEFSYNSPLGGDGKEVGYYFLQGGFGVIFPENEKGFRNAQLVKASNPALWALETHKILKNGITLGFMTIDHCGIAGEKLLNEGKFKDACFCYELGKNSKEFEGREKIRDRYFAGYATALFNCGDNQQAVKLLLSEMAINPKAFRCAEILQRICEIHENRNHRNQPCL
jgi:hypothetical protein